MHWYLSVYLLQTFIKAVMANWFVCLAVWQATAAQTFGGKFIACLSGISAFVAIGLEHCVANMVFVPLGILTGKPSLIWLIQNHFSMLSFWLVHAWSTMSPLAFNFIEPVILVSALSPCSFAIPWFTTSSLLQACKVWHGKSFLSAILSRWLWGILWQGHSV